ncbi:MAG: UDP-N-acetylglucosamine--N-acetylmuramyl-(pentapeptide) pyrophosphoryl-undecaprenol N-acetylglucosamine transferase, partial [Proteobacteria bacterium]|nr:UDP-N-acetylglucosamine--N-acetylmuramyl-(pentapeptide) pyrophosphoryl-undecaprenol N-acetylglucosamine transferase [Pseudomonadota bacterium]
MGERLGAAHLVIARAGASTVTELQVAGRPAILVPFAAAADDHQTANAEGLTGVGAADLFTEADFEPVALSALLERRLGDPHGLAVRAAAARAAAKPEAAKTLADLAESISA